MVHIGEGNHPENTPANTRRSAKAAEYNSKLEIAKRQEEAFIASARSTVTASGGTLNLHLRNPSGSDRLLDVADITIGTQFEGIYTVWDTFSTAPSGGTANGIDNLRLDSDAQVDKGSMVVNQDVTFTGDTEHAQYVIPSGGAGGQVGGAANASVPILEETREIVIEVVNQSGSDADASIEVVYIED